MFEGVEEILGLKKLKDVKPVTYSEALVRAHIQVERGIEDAFAASFHVAVVFGVTKEKALRDLIKVRIRIREIGLGGTGKGIIRRRR